MKKWCFCGHDYFPCSLLLSGNLFFWCLTVQQTVAGILAASAVNVAARHDGKETTLSPEPQTEPADLQEKRRQDYWKANLRLVSICLVIWFLASYGCGILFAETLNQFQLFGFKLGFWFAQQGSIYIFLLLILFYILRINALDRRFGVLESTDPDGDQ